MDGHVHWSFGKEPVTDCFSPVYIFTSITDVAVGALAPFNVGKVCTWCGSTVEVLHTTLKNHHHFNSNWGYWRYCVSSFPFNTRLPGNIQLSLPKFHHPQISLPSSFTTPNAAVSSTLIYSVFTCIIIIWYLQVWSSASSMVHAVWGQKCVCEGLNWEEFQEPSVYRSWTSSELYVPPTSFFTRQRFNKLLIQRRWDCKRW